MTKDMEKLKLTPKLALEKELVANQDLLCWPRIVVASLDGYGFILEFACYVSLIRSCIWIVYLYMFCAYWGRILVRDI